MVKENMTLQGTCVHAYVHYTYVYVLVSLCIYFYVITVNITHAYKHIYTVSLHSGVIKVSVYSTPDWWKLHVLFNVSTCKAIPSPHMQKE